MGVDNLHPIGVGYLQPHMPPKKSSPDRAEILQGTLDLLILTTLKWGPQHGYALSLAIRANSGDYLLVETGSLYPALHRLERQGWVASEWKPTSALNSTASPQQERSGSSPSSPAGSNWSKPWPAY